MIIPESYTYFADISSWFFLVYLIGTTANSSIANLLDYLNRRREDLKERAKGLWAKHPLAKKLLSWKKISKAVDYHESYGLFTDFTCSLDNALGFIILLVGLAPFALQFFIGLTGSVTASYILLAITSSLLKLVVDIPETYYGTFHIEQRFGFNNMTKATFWKDQLKDFAISSVFVSVVIPIVNYALVSFGPYSRGKIVLLTLGFIAMGMVWEFIWSTVVVRMYNKLEPLRNKRLGRKIAALYRKCGYKVPPKMFVMDSSKRSSHGNAYVSGIGPSRKIVLFDTLLKNHTDEEIVAILAHEIGHAKNHDLVKDRIYSGLFLLAKMFVTFSFIYDVRLYHAFGFSWVTDENVLQYSFIGFILMSTMMSSILWILTPVFSWLSRLHERRADEYAASKTSAEAMSDALIRLGSDNLSDVFPHRWYESWYYSHPSLENRLAPLARTRRRHRKERRQ